MDVFVTRLDLPCVRLGLGLSVVAWIRQAFDQSGRCLMFKYLWSVCSYYCSSRLASQSADESGESPRAPRHYGPHEPLF